MIRILFCWFGLLLASHAATLPNLVENGDFKNGPWQGRAQAGHGSIALTGDKEGDGETRTLDLIGQSDDAIVNVRSNPIAVESGGRYTLAFHYRLSYGKGNVKVTWSDGGNQSGYIFTAAESGSDWLTLADALERKRMNGLLFSKGIGASEGRSAQRTAVIVIPKGVASVAIQAQMRGRGVFSLASVALTRVEPAEATGGDSALDAIRREEAQRLLISDPVSSKGRPPKATAHLKIHEPPAVPKRNRQPEAYPDSATDLRIRGDQFVHGEKPAFLLGLEDEIVRPWFYRLLGIDFVHLHVTSMNSVMRPRKVGDTWEVSWQRPDWLEDQLKLTLAGGVAVLINVGEERTEIFNGEVPDSTMVGSHFAKFRFDTPEGRQLRQGMWQTVLDVGAAYPVFAYKLFTEIVYMDYSPANLLGFRAAMEARYGTIEAANRIWGTDFPSFSKTMPPRKEGGWGFEQQMTPRNFSRPLWVDWQKYIEKTFAGHLGDLARFIHGFDSKTYLTLQTTSFVPQDYSGGPGVYPPAVMKAIDFWGDECGGGVYIAQDSGEDLAEIGSMVQSQMRSSLMSFLAHDQPVLDEEIPFAGHAHSRPPQQPGIIDLKGKWKFHPDNENQGREHGYQQPDFNDSAWRPITVPGLWGEQGYADVSHGWYRAEIQVPASARGKSFFLNGSRLTDRATVYVNGQPVHQTRHWAERFGIDIGRWLKPGEKNVLAVELENKTRAGGMYQGGIREYLAIDEASFSARAPLRPNQMRSALWSKLVSGKNGVIQSYAYVAEGVRNSMFNPGNVSMEAICAIPWIKNEINQIGDIVLENHRAPRSVALSFSFESGRARVYRDAETWGKALANTDLAQFYMALAFGDDAPDMVNNDAILEGRCEKHAAIIFRMSERVAAGIPERLGDYAQKGGVVLIDHGSLAINDDTHAPLDLEPLAGVRVGEALTTPATVLASDAGLLPGNVVTVARHFDGHTGCRVQPTSATVLLRFEDGSPALTMQPHGAGCFYYLAAEFPYKTLRTLLPRLLARHGIVNRQVTLEPEAGKGTFVDRRVFTGSDGARLVYLHNWGMTAQATLRLPSLPDGNYRMRHFELKEEPTEREVAGKTLREGLGVALPSQDPQLFLLEKADAPARPFAQLPEPQRAMLDLYRPSPRQPFRVAVSAGRYEVITKIRIPTATRLLEENGYEVNTSLQPPAKELAIERGGVFSQEPLASYQIFATLGSCMGTRRFSPEELTLLKNYVEAGGGLLIAANQVEGPNNWLSNRNAKDSLTALFKVETTDKNVSDSARDVDGIAMHPVLEAVEGHPMTRGIKSLPSRGTSVLKLPGGTKATVLARSSAGATPAHAPAMVALEYGKGRVVILGDAKWMQPDVIGQGDNARFFLNLIHWLAHRDDAIGQASSASIEKSVRFPLLLQPPSSATLQAP